ncbi:MAG TPA: GNAT family N-acetyltransferase [Acidimicrobiales bacterium]|nr:GNAT family N-acetyltransferase [Acidimicrobiales bacterium]
MTRRADVVLRPARRDESDAVADLWLAARAAAVPAIPRAVHDDGEVRRWFADVVFGSARQVLVAEENGRLVALLVLDDPTVEQLYVHPDRTGQGIGSRLIDLAKRGRQFLELRTFQSNAGARRFYERHGFVATWTTDGDNEERAPDVGYEWRRG